MKAEIINVGTELLLGHILNTNAAFLSQKLSEIGIDVYYQTSVGDNRTRIIESIRSGLKRSDIIIITGGLGPTVDDITTESLAYLIGRRLVLNKTVLRDVKNYFKDKKSAFPSESIRQAYIPEGVKWVRNNVGTAPALISEFEERTIICLPGPPRELKPMVTNDIVPYLKSRFKCGGILKSRSIKMVGIPESVVDGRVRDLLKLKPPLTVGIYAGLGEVTLKIMSKAKTRARADVAIGKIERIIRERLGRNIFGYDDQTLEGAVGAVLEKKRVTIAVAESCTGGLLSHRLTNISGSSAYFTLGVTVYANKMKTNVLGVSKKAIERHGAVSREVAVAMAEGVRALARTDIGTGITGIAGPGGGTKHKPVGLVYVAVISGRKKEVQEFRFKGSREEIKFQATQAALNMIRITA